MKQIRSILFAVAAIACGTTALAQTAKSPLLAHEQQIDGIISSMTLEEKIDMLHGKNMFSSAGIPRLGIADMEYADGPFGIREEMEPHSWNSAHLTTDSATFFPTGSALAATWSTEWAYNYGRGMSREARLRGKDMILGPAINIHKFVGDVKRDGWRAYVFRQDDHGVAAVWTNERQAELGRKKGRMLKLALPKDVRFVDLMGNRRSGVSDQVSGVSTDPCPLTTDHLFPIPLTPAPLFILSKDAEGLLKAFENAGGKLK